MKYLIDTQSFLWFFGSPTLLTVEAINLMNDDHRLFFSAASAWEIAIKYSIGKLKLPEPPEVYVPRRMHIQGFEWLPIQSSHALAVSTLPPIHKDPFDRLLVAQALVERLTMITSDQVFASYLPDIIFSAQS